jgi:hypothetical protein
MKIKELSLFLLISLGLVTSCFARDDESMKKELEFNYALSQASRSLNEGLVLSKECLDGFLNMPEMSLEDRDKVCLKHWYHYYNIALFARNSAKDALKKYGKQSKTDFHNKLISRINLYSNKIRKNEKAIQRAAKKED